MTGIIASPLEDLGVFEFDEIVDVGCTAVESADFEEKERKSLLNNWKKKKKSITNEGSINQRAGRF